MRLLFNLDQKNYDPNATVYVRNSARSIIIKNGRIAMVHSLRYNYYKFPGGGIEEGETYIDAVIRETKEEAGLIVIPQSVKEYGFVHRIQKNYRKENETFVQDNFYYLCDIENASYEQKLDDYEAFEQFTFEWVDPIDAINANKEPEHGPKDSFMIEREARVLEMLINEGYFNK